MPSIPSRPNEPVNVLVALDMLKARFGWSDEELYDHFVFDMQVRYAVGYRNLEEGEFELRTLYYFRHRLARHNVEHHENLLAKAFEQMTDQQARAHKVNLTVQRMDSTQIMSNIVDASRFQLLVEVIQRLARIMSEAEQAQYAELLGPYIEKSAEQFIYPIKGREAWEVRLVEIGPGDVPAEDRVGCRLPAGAHLPGLPADVRRQLPGAKAGGASPSEPRHPFRLFAVGG